MTVTGAPLGQTRHVQVRKGHGTENDFVVLHDPDNEQASSDALVVALCDRRAGVGGDGLLRVVRTAALVDTDPTAAAAAAGSEWFMDYRNADASVAEMCGNGVRVVAEHLATAGCIDRARPLLLGTRGGTKRVTFTHGLISVQMGRARVGRDDLTVTTEVGAARATQVWMPNPHAVAITADLALAGELRHAPLVTPAGAFPEGVNVEIVQLVGPGHLRLRVHERGVGETRSCGTGICAAAVVASHEAVARGWGALSSWEVDVPGGRLQVDLRPSEHGDEVTLTGPAVMVGTISLDEAWLAAVGVGPRVGASVE